LSAGTVATTDLSAPVDNDVASFPDQILQRS
jgi:hypothetical protein